ncbi:MAG: hypothetical protein SV375_13275 [Thermodesulfobacteriota bacterium]|nr:hypothetical protein [Thermodesulfobacteriota bacterium]
MSDKEHIVSLLKEAELYRTQGLLEQSKEKFKKALGLVESHNHFSKDKKLIDALNNKIRTVENKMVEIDEATDTPELTQDTQNLIGKLFSFSKDKDMAEIEGAVALTKFGQYEKAMKEFQRMIKAGILPLLAAKNLLRCHLALSLPDAAVAQFKQWVSIATFQKTDLHHLRAFLENILKQKGINADLPQIMKTMPDKGETKEKDEDVIDLSSLKIQLTKGPRKGQKEEFDVTFQSGNSINIIIPAKKRELIDAFEPGMKLTKMQCYSPLAVFNSDGVVSEKTRISSGPKQGDYALDIIISSD